MDVKYERRADDVLWRFQIAKQPLMFYASNIRRERGEAKAKVKIGIPGSRALAYTVLDLDDDGKRGALANRAADGMWGVKYNDAKAIDLRERLMLFCDGLYDYWIGEASGSDVKGDTSPSAPPWDVPGLVLRGSTSIWYGDRGANKSTLMRAACQSLRWSWDRVIPIVHDAMAIWVNAEESPEEHTRQLGNVNQALGLPREAEMYTVHARGMSIQDLAPRLRKAVETTSAQHVFIDSLSRLAQGMNLNDNSTATLLVDSLADLGTSVNWIGHTGQENRHRMAGSRHFENAARLMVRVQSRMSIGGVSPHLKRGVRTTVRKANGAVVTEPMHWSAEYHSEHGIKSLELADSFRWPMLSCDAVYGERQRICGRRTWDGVRPDGLVRCPMHDSEEEED